MRLRGAGALAAALLMVSGCAPARRAAPLRGDDRVQVRVVWDEVDAAAEILRHRLEIGAPTNQHWSRLFATEGYQRLRQRELGMGRTFTDSAFRAFLLSDSLAFRARTLLATVDAWRRTDFAAPGAGVLAFLPAGTRIRANLYPMIKPATNSFVFRGDSVPGIFIYIDPVMERRELVNTTAHELHHIGFEDGCPYRPDTTIALPLRTMYRRLWGFGEGLAMFAAAGGAGRHPQADRQPVERRIWDRNIAQVGEGFAGIETFIRDVLEGRVTSVDSISRAAFSFYGEQGPWYTVGWYMADAIERAAGRERLIAVTCRPKALMTAYNAVAQPPQPRWSDEVLRRLPD